MILASLPGESSPSADSIFLFASIVVVAAIVVAFVWWLHAIRKKKE